jgi:hypothetical protein
MGFTRNFWIIGNFSLEESRFREFSKTCKELCREISKKYGGSISGPHGSGEPIFLEHVVAFNGSDDDSCETFSINIKDEGFQFCKTNRKPYDSHVLGCLILATKFFGDTIKFRFGERDSDIKIKDFVTSFLRDKKLDDLINI